MGLEVSVMEMEVIMTLETLVFIVLFRSSCKIVRKFRLRRSHSRIEIDKHKDKYLQRREDSYQDNQIKIF